MSWIWAWVGGSNTSSFTKNGDLDKSLLEHFKKNQIAEKIEKRQTYMDNYQKNPPEDPKKEIMRLLNIMDQMPDGNREKKKELATQLYDFMAFDKSLTQKYPRFRTVALNRLMFFALNENFLLPCQYYEISGGRSLYKDMKREIENFFSDCCSAPWTEDLGNCTKCGKKNNMLFLHVKTNKID